MQVEISNSSVNEEINRTVLTVNCDNKETDLNNNNNENDNDNDNNHESEKEKEERYHLNIEIPGDTGGLSKNEDQGGNSSDDILVSLARSAKEMREIIMGRKKKDPRKEKRKDLRRRVEMIEEL